MRVVDLMKKEIFNIIGMHCASCSLTIERALKKVTGVKNSDVNYGTEQATIEYDESLTNPEKLAAAVKSIGYTLAL